jgi:hypothetical protein
MRATALFLALIPSVTAFVPTALRRTPAVARRGQVDMLSIPRFGRKAQLPAAAVLSNDAPSQDLATTEAPQKALGGGPDFALLLCFALWYLVSGSPGKERFCG